MARSNGAAPAPSARHAWREGLWLLAFVLIVATGIVTVALPELDKDPDASAPQTPVPDR